MRNELAMFDFRPDEKQALPAHRASDRIDGIDCGFPFRNARLPSWAEQGYPLLVSSIYFSYLIIIRILLAGLKSMKVNVCEIK